MLVDTSTTWGRQVVRGIHNYARVHGPWQTYIEPRGIEEKMMIPQGWIGDGIIARIGHLALAQELHTMKLPAVNISGIRLPTADSFPRVVSDLSLSGRLAADYFRERGYAHFAYFSLIHLRYVATHRQAFVDALKQTAHSCAIFKAHARHGAEPDWNLDVARLGEWLKQLPKPVAILTWNVSSSRLILYACETAGLLIPEEVAILSGTDDVLLCEFSNTPISGIQVAGEQIGHRAAALLDSLMRGKHPPAHPISVPPLGVITRRSTDTLALGNSTLTKAISFMRANSAKHIRVTDVARHTGVSRRILEMKFRENLRRSPASEIRRMHLDRARELLSSTDLSIPDVAKASGFGSPEYFASTFKAYLKTTPLRYRRTIRCR